MGAIFRSWWQQIKQHRASIEVAGIIFVVVIVLIIIGYWFDWTGFNGFNQVTITRTISGTNAGTVTRTEEYQLGKGLWDWLQLLGVLAIPVVVGFGAVWFTTRQGKVADAENKDNQRETALQAYIDKMSELLLHEKLRESKPEDEMRNTARVRSLTVLRNLDADRQVRLLLFLKEASLLNEDNSIINLYDVDLSYTNLRYIHLNNVNLSGANLEGTNLSFAALDHSNLSRAILVKANLRGVHLTGANLSEAMMDGASLRGAFLMHANLYYASLSRVNLSEAILSDANLSGAVLDQANLIEADLSRANLTGAVVTQERLKTAKSLEGAIGLDQIDETSAKYLEENTMPDGSIRE